MLCSYDHYLFPEIFQHPKQILYPFNGNSPLLTSILETSTLPSVSVNLPMLGTADRSRLHEFVFCDWLVSLNSIMSSKLIHIVACVRISFFLWPNNISLCVCSTFCLSIYPLRDPGLWAPLGHRDTALDVVWSGSRTEAWRRSVCLGWFLSTQVQLPIELQGYVHEASLSAGRGLRGYVASVGCICSRVLPSKRALPGRRLRGLWDCMWASSASWVWGTCWAEAVQEVPGIGSPLPEIRMTLGCCRTGVWRASSVRERGSDCKVPRASTVWRGEARDSVCLSQLLELNTRLGVL